MVKAFVESDLKKVSAKTLTDAGFLPNKVNKIIEAQNRAHEAKNDRLIKFLNNYVSKELDDTPPIWRSLVAGAPIIGKDIGSECLIQLGSLVAEMHPYLSKQLRKDYHNRAAPFLIGKLAETPHF